MKDNLGPVISKYEAQQKAQRNGDGLYFVENADGERLYGIIIEDGVVLRMVSAS